MLTPKPKAAFEILRSVLENSLSENVVLNKKVKMDILKAQCKRMAGRTEVIGRTVFKFDGSGITEVKNEGYTKYDFDVLCDMNGVVDVTEWKTQPTVVPPEPKTEVKTKIESTNAAESKTEVTSESTSALSGGSRSLEVAKVSMEKEELSQESDK